MKWLAIGAKFSDKPGWRNRLIAQDRRLQLRSDRTDPYIPGDPRPLLVTESVKDEMRDASKDDDGA